MSYKVKYSKMVYNQIKKLDNYTRAMLLNWISKNLVSCDDLRVYGKSLKRNLKN